MAMAFRFRCHHCGQKIRADQRHAGRQAKCPNCRATLVIPQPHRAPSAADDEQTRTRPLEPPGRSRRPQEVSSASSLPDLSLSPLLAPLPIPRPVAPASTESGALQFAYPQRQRIKIAVIGAGAVGCFYGARLARVGHDVHFVMRRDLQAVRHRGLDIVSCDGDFHIAAQTYQKPEQIGRVDLVLCALKTTSLDEAEGLMRPCVGPDTFVLALMNGLGVEEKFGQWFGAERVFGGLAFVCINRGEPGTVHHHAYGRVTFGHLLDDTHQASAIAAMFAEAGIESHVAPSLKQARWEKLVWNVPFNSLSVSAGVVSTQRIMDDPGLQELTRCLMSETIAAGNACGCSIDPPVMMEKMFAQTATMGHYKTSMMIDFEQQRPLEVEAMLGEPVRQAIHAGIAVPYMQTQYELVRFLDLVNRGEVTRCS